MASYSGLAQPPPLGDRLGAALLTTPAVVLALLLVFALLLHVWTERYERRWYRENAVRVQQHRDATWMALTGNYFLANTLLLATGHDSFANTIPRSGPRPFSTARR